MVGTSNLGSWNGHWHMGYNEDMGLGWPWSKLGYSLVNLQKTMERSTELKIEPKVESQEPVDVNLGGGEGSTSRLGVLLSLVVFLDLILLVATLGHLLESSENGQKRISWMREEVRRHVSSGSAASTTSWYSARASSKRSLVQNCRWQWWW